MNGHKNFHTSWGKTFFSPEKQIWDNAFHKNVKIEHFFEKYQAWALARETLRYLRDRGIQKIILTCEEEGKVYTTTFDKFTKLGIRDDFGHAGTQYFLPVTGDNYKVTRLK